MSELRIWEFLWQQLKTEGQVGLMVVVQSEGSSPGRKGFKMALAGDGSMIGSIGGGIMEHKLVEYVRDKLTEKEHLWELRKQVHSKDVARDQSGMICSGRQWIAIVRLDSAALETVNTIVESLRGGGKVEFNLTHSGLYAVAETAQNIGGSTDVSGSSGYSGSLGHPSLPDLFLDGEWAYSEVLGRKPVVHVIGGGHVGHAMCRVMSMLDFHVVNYDDRPGLNTMEANEFAHEKIVIPYPEVGTVIEGGESVYVIVMTFGYRGDDQAIRALLGKQFAYLGMMGSETKVAKLLHDLEKDGFPKDQVANIHTPAGLTLHCETPIEIAVSVAAEIIDVKNNGQKAHT